MTILNSCMEAYAVIPQLFLQILNQYIRFFRRYMSGRVILQNLSFHANQITTHRHFSRFQVYTDTGCFERPASFIHFRKIISQHGHIGNFTTRMETFGNSYQTSIAPHACQLIHIRRLRILQKRLVSQGLHRPVGHSVSQYNNMLHFFNFLMDNGKWIMKDTMKIH